EPGSTRRGARVHLRPHDRLPAGDSFQQFVASGAHEAVDAHDLPAAYFQVDAVHDGPLGVLPVGHHQITHLQDRFAELVARRRFAQVEVLPDHVPHDPFQVDLAALTVCSDAAVAQHDGAVGHLEGFLQVVGDVDDGHSAGEELADDLEEHLYFGGGQGRGGLVHDQDA